MIGTLLAGLVMLSDVAILCVDAPGATCSAIAPRVSAELEKQGRKVVTPNPATGIGAINPPTFEPAAIDAKTALDEGVKLFYDGKLSEAKAAIDRANATMARVALPMTSQRVEIHLWRATIAYGSEQVAEGNNAIADALTLEPELVVKTDVFPPALKDLVENDKKNRIATASRVPVSFELPAGSELTIDGKRIDGLNPQLLRGRHWFTVTAPGYAPFWRGFETEEAKISVTLAPQLDPALESAVVTPRANVPALTSYAQTLGVSSLILLNVGFNTAKETAVRVTVMNPEPVGSDGGPFRATDISQIAGFIVSKLNTKVGVTATPRPTPTRGGAGDKVFALEPSAALLVTSWQRQLDVSAEGYDDPVPLVGVGPNIGFDFEHLALGVVAHADAAFLTYGLNTVQSQIGPRPNPTAPAPTASKKGGSAMHVNAGVGYKLRFGEEAGELGSPFVVGMAGVATESYTAIELEREGETGPQAVLPMYGSHERLGPFVRVEVAYPVSTVRLRGGAGLWLSSYKETPDGVNGRDPKADPVPLVSFGVDYKVSDSLSIVGDARGQMRSVSYSSTESSNAVDEVQGAKLNEVMGQFSVTARWSF